MARRAWTRRGAGGGARRCEACSAPVRDAGAATRSATGPSTAATRAACATRRPTRSAAATSPRWQRPGASAPATSTPTRRRPGTWPSRRRRSLVGEQLVLPTPLGRVLALDPETGTRALALRQHGAGREYSEFTSRGVAFWEDATARPRRPCRRRIFAATVESRLFALDADDGARCRGFGATARWTCARASARSGPGTTPPARRPWSRAIS